MAAHCVWKAFLRAIGWEEVRRCPLGGAVTNEDSKFLWPSTSVQFSLKTRDGVHRTIDTRLPSIFPFRATKVAVHPARLIIGALNSCPIIGACCDEQVTVVNGHRHHASCIMIADAAAIGPLVAGIVPIDVT